MPLYDIRCSRTGAIFERMIPLAKFEEEIICSCHAVARRVISTPLFTVDQTGYNCPVTDKWVGSKRQHEENLKQTGCRVLETGEKEATEQFRAREEASFDRKIEETIEREIEGYSSSKREALHNDLINLNSDLALERR